ncbi:hypothetical protein [Deefgea rivuli]|uniref:hypothetical protein n=1 Tax=Deefgea rivuli TaxID=400948 RepID=UPI000484B19B|nr:hypothetical protein [Deefgea rivuli]
MSEEVPVSEPHSESIVGHSPVSFFAQHRLAIVGAGVFVLVLIFLLVGIAIGMAKKNFEKKFYLTQIEKLKVALSDSLEKRSEQEKDMTALKVELRAKKDHLAELEDKVETLERASQRGETATGEPQAKSAESAPTSGAVPDPSEAYLRLKAGDCLIEGSTSNTAANWRECLKKGKKTATSANPAASGH